MNIVRKLRSVITVFAFTGCQRFTVLVTRFCLAGSNAWIIGLSFAGTGTDIVSHLNRGKRLAGAVGFEPTTPGFGDRCSKPTELRAFTSTIIDV